METTRISAVEEVVCGPWPDEQLVACTVGELRALAAANPLMDMQRESALAFGNMTRPEPGLPVWTKQERATLLRFSEQIAELAARLKEGSRQARANGHPVLADWIIRLQLSVEETGELGEAVAEGDLAHALNELTDLAYVVDGNYLTMGADRLKLEAYAEVHSANMSKLVPCPTCAETGPHDPVSGADCPTCAGLGKVGQVNEAGRHIKGPGYRKPDLARVLKDSA